MWRLARHKTRRSLSSTCPAIACMSSGGRAENFAARMPDRRQGCSAVAIGDCRTTAGHNSHGHVIHSLRLDALAVVTLLNMLKTKRQIHNAGPSVRHHASPALYRQRNISTGSGKVLTFDNRPFLDNTERYTCSRLHWARRISALSTSVRCRHRHSAFGWPELSRTSEAVFWKCSKYYASTSVSLSALPSRFPLQAFLASSLLSI
jgi:hypothetical protein